jgi:hypothetical protein
MVCKRVEGAETYTALLLNDDSAVLGSNTNMDEFIDIDDEICTGLGLLTKPEKSFQEFRPKSFLNTNIVWESVKSLLVVC